MIQLNIFLLYILGKKKFEFSALFFAKQLQKYLLYVPKQSVVLKKLRREGKKRASLTLFQAANTVIIYTYITVQNSFLTGIFTNI